MSFLENLDPGAIGKTPVHNGDGYNFGGDLTVTIGDICINLGTDQNADALTVANLIAVSPDLYRCLREFVEYIERTSGIGKDDSERDEIIRRAKIILKMAEWPR